MYIYNNKFTAQTNILEFSIKNCVLVLFFMSIVFRAFSSFSYEIKAIVVIAILCVSKRLPSIFLTFRLTYYYMILILYLLL